MGPPLCGLGSSLETRNQAARAQPAAAPVVQKQAFQGLEGLPRCGARHPCPGGLPTLRWSRPFHAEIAIA